MTDYRMLTEDLPDPFKNKPKWMKCVIFLAGLAVMTICAVGAGILIGYTYCYMAHRTGLSPINVTELQKLQVSVPVGGSKGNHSMESINAAILTQIQNMLKFGHKMLDGSPYKLDKKEEVEM